MPSPAALAQVIRAIIDATPDITPEIRQPLEDELLEQYEELLIQVIRESLSQAQLTQFEQLLTKSTDPAQMQQFLIDCHLNPNLLTTEATNRLRQTQD